MSKKNKKNRNETVFQTLSRLATTVKADVPTLVLKEHKGSGASDGKGKAGTADAPRARSRMSVLAARMNPFASRDKKLKKIAKHMNHTPGHAMTTRRSRLPVVLAVLGALLAFMGYRIYQAISLPDFKVAQYLDHEKWLDLVSGKTSPEATMASTKQRVLATKSSNAAKVTSAPATKVALKSSSNPVSKQSVPKLTAAQKKQDKSFRKLPRSAKEKAWKSKLAKLEKQSEKKYQKASTRYREKQ